MSYDRDFASERFFVRQLPRIPISGPVYVDRGDRAVFWICAACAAVGLVMGWI